MAIKTLGVLLQGGLSGAVDTAKGQATTPRALITAVDTAIDAAQAGSLADLTAAMAVLQADGASPTEAHVDTADTALIAFTAALAAVQTTETTAALASLPATGDLVVSIDLATVTTKNRLLALLEPAQKYLMSLLPS